MFKILQRNHQGKPTLRSLLRSLGLPSAEQSTQIQSMIQQCEQLLSPNLTEEQSVTPRNQSRIFDSTKFRPGEETPPVLPHASEADLRLLDSSLKSLFSPFRRLHVELIVEIFVHCLPPEHYIYPSPDEAPLLLLQVCGSWRDLALSTPYLWQSLKIPDGPDRRDDLLSLAKLWVSASGTAPLDLDIATWAFSSSSFMSFLNKHSSHWRDVKIWMDSMDESSFYFPQVVPLLQSIDFTFSGGLDEVQRGLLATALNSAPLRHLRWNNPDNILGFSIRWEQLSHVRIESIIGLEDCLEILKYGIMLEDVAFQAILAGGHAASDNILCRHLRTMILTTDRDLFRFFQALECPMLDGLAIKMWHGGDWSRDCFPRFLARSRCAIQNLDLYFCPLSEAMLIGCLQHIHHSLQELTIHVRQPVFTDLFLDQLTYKEPATRETPFLCPRLEVLAMYQCINCSPGRLRSMMRSRLHVPRKPRTDPSFVSQLAIFETFSDIDEFESIRELRREGLIVKSYIPEDGSDIPLEPEDLERLKELKREGYTLRTYMTEEAMFMPMES